MGSSLLASNELLLPMAIIIVITPILHRSFNLIGYAIGWKDVPY
ncbi:MAG: CDP-archaeol synthase [Candidatus Poseidoniaceae archaeon]